MKILRVLFSCLLTGAIFIFGIKPALAFCGFYVAKADSSLYNQASQVIIARDGRRTVLTMSNDYQGDVKDFAMVVPVPVVLTEEQVHINDSKIIERLSQSELKQAGVTWLDSNNNVFITRLHVRYNRDKFPEDLKFQSTSDRTNFQGKYIIRHPFVQEDPDQQYCSQTPGSYRRAYLKYRLELSSRRKKNAQTLAKLTN